MCTIFNLTLHVVALKEAPTTENNTSHSVEKKRNGYFVNGVPMCDRGVYVGWSCYPCLSDVSIQSCMVGIV